MKIVDIKSVEEKDIVAPLFTGGKVHTQSLLEEEFGGDKIQIVNVKFAPGARNKFHTHTTEQILFVIEGEGIVATRDEERTVTPGTLIYFNASEEHWHGATKDSSFAHLSILNPQQEMKITGE
jgi:quercetin dioxygenase-like cupin family protein